jgi:hypothetical protein
MGLRLALQPFWIRALGYGIPFAVLFGLQISFQQPSRAVSVVVSTVLSGAAFGLLMAYQGQSTHTALTEAVAGLDQTTRVEAIAAVTKGGVPDDPMVRNSAIRLGNAYLGGKSDTQLKRRDRQSWLVLPLFVAAGAYLVTISTSTYQAVFAVALVLLCLVVLPLGVLRSRKFQRNVAQLRAGAISS